MRHFRANMDSHRRMCFKKNIAYLLSHAANEINKGKKSNTKIQNDNSGTVSSLHQGKTDNFTTTSNALPSHGETDYSIKASTDLPYYGKTDISLIVSKKKPSYGEKGNNETHLLTETKNKKVQNALEEFSRSEIFSHKKIDLMRKPSRQSIEIEKETSEDRGIIIDNIPVTVLGISSCSEENRRFIVMENDSAQESNTKHLNREPQDHNSPSVLEEFESGELHPTFTEIIADQELALMRKTLEDDDTDIAEGTDITNLINNSQVQILEKKAKRRHEKDTYVDFLSDEEEFVWDSSSWKDTGDDATSSDSESYKPVKRRKKDNIKNRNVGVVGLRKKNKDARNKGQEYVKKDGRIVSARSLQPNPCVGKTCGKNFQEITEDRRKNIFDHFWGLPPQGKKDWLIAMSSRCDVQRKRSKESTYRDNTYYYFINEGEGRRKVCKQFIMKTLDVSPRYINYTLANAHLGPSKEGKTKVVSKNKTFEELEASAINFIQSLPVLTSHTDGKLYLDTEFQNISKLYKIYKEFQTNKKDIVSIVKFLYIFARLAIRIPSLKRDNCIICFKIQDNDTHSNEVKACKKRLAFHLKICKKNKSILCTSFKLQKVLNTPHGQSTPLFLYRKYSVFNLCFYESTNKGFCYTWGESDGEKGGNEIATILQKYIADVDSRGTIKKLILYSEPDPGHYKNKIVLAALHHALLQVKHIETIQMNYIVPGHTKMPVDIMHAKIEKSVQNTTIWAPSQWVTVFQLARKNPTPYYVEALTHIDFKNFEEFSEHYFIDHLYKKINSLTATRVVNRRLNDLESPFHRGTQKLKEPRVATLKKSSLNFMTIRFSMADNAYDHVVGINTKPKQLYQIYKTDFPITTTKYKDLKKMCDTGIIPPLYHSAYLNLAHQHGTDFLLDIDVKEETESTQLHPRVLQLRSELDLSSRDKLAIFHI